MARAKSPSSTKKSKEQAVNTPIIPDANPVAAETAVVSKPQVADQNLKAQAAAAGAAAVQSPPATEARKFEVRKAETRRNVVPINIEDEIRQRAYEIFQQRGQAPGSDADDWLAAEREVMQRYRQQRA
jgi:Protein of unknown function (DUF2934)